VEEKLLKELGEKLSTATKGIDAILKAAEQDGNRQLTDDERTKLDAAEAEADTLQAEITKVEADRQRKARQADRQTFLRTPNQRITTPGTPDDHSGVGENELNAAMIRAVPSTSRLCGFADRKAAYLSGQWIRATLFKSQDAHGFLERNAPHYLAMAGQQDAKGGALVPPDFRAAMVMLLEEYGTARRKCDVAPMVSDTQIWPRFVSGLTTYFVGENSDITASDPAFNNITLTARKLAALCKIPTELIEDAVIDVANLVARNAAYAMAVKEDQCLFLGTAASTYGGITGLITALTTATASTVTAATANTAYSTLDLTDFESMVGKLPIYPGINPEWFIHKAGWAASMMRLQDAAGGNTSADVGGGPGGTQFLGFPVNFVQCMNSTLTAQTSTKGLCYFGDLRMAVTFGDRRAINMKTLVERYAEYDQVGLVATERFDINVHDVGDTSSAGAVIMLATPSS